jgi:P27 family predicted phage terminase small subunit
MFAWLTTGVTTRRTTNIVKGIGMKPGPAPKPTVLKRLAGNPGKKRLNDNEPQPKKPSRTPYVPRFLSETAKDEWRRLVDLLIELGIYTEIDRTAFTMYCLQFGKWIEAEKMISETGGEILTSEKGNLYQNPWSFVANKAYDQMIKMLLEFGMTPSSRSRLHVDPKTDRPTLAEVLFEGVAAETRAVDDE